MQYHSEASPDVAAIEEVKIATFISTKKKNPFSAMSYFTFCDAGIFLTKSHKWQSYFKLNHNVFLDLTM